MTEKPDEVEIQVWWAPGDGMMYNTYALDHDHPMHPYHQLAAKGLEPEDYGVFNPLTEQFKDYNRAQLIGEIVKLKKEILGLYRAEAMGVINFK